MSVRTPAGSLPRVRLDEGTEAHVAAMCRLLCDSGDMTPMGARQMIAAVATHRCHDRYPRDDTNVVRALLDSATRIQTLRTRIRDALTKARNVRDRERVADMVELLVLALHEDDRFTLVNTEQDGDHHG